MPPFPALGWDANPANGQHHPEPPHGGGVDQPEHEPQPDHNAEGWGPWEEAVVAQNAPVHEPAVQEAQDQNSMVLNPSLGSNSSSDDQSAGIEVVQQVVVQENLERAIVPYIPPAVHPPMVNLDPIHLGIVRVVFGPVLPPAMVWERSFKNLLPDFEIQNIHRPVCLSVLPPAVLPMRMWPQELEHSFQSLVGQVSDGMVGGDASQKALIAGFSTKPVEQDVFAGDETMRDLPEVFSAEPV